jgi:hypothetical protein
MDIFDRIHSLKDGGDGLNRSFAGQGPKGVYHDDP